MLVYISNIFFTFYTTYKPLLNIDDPDVIVDQRFRKLTDETDECKVIDWHT
jgi:hypothetical protein